MWTACTSSGHIVTARSLASQSSADWPHKGAELLACTGLTAWEVSPERLLGRLLMREGSVCRGFAAPRLTQSSGRNYSSFGKGSRGSRAENEAAASAGVVGQLEWARAYEDHLGRFEHVAEETGREAHGGGHEGVELPQRTTEGMPDCPHAGFLKAIGQAQESLCVVRSTLRGRVVLALGALVVAQRHI